MSPSRRGLRADFLRFAESHSWYKHLPLEGEDFYAFMAEGEQPRNGISAEVNDWHGLHWHFSTRAPPPPVPSYKVRFGPFLRGTPRGFHIIVDDAGADVFEAWLSQHYPTVSAAHLSPADITHIFAAEQEKYWLTLVAAVLPAAPGATLATPGCVPGSD